MERGEEVGGWFAAVQAVKVIGGRGVKAGDFSGALGRKWRGLG